MISILLPFHNAAPWIEETILSIQNQSYTDWELIAINDFSTDDSLFIIQNLAKDESRIQLYQNREKGIIPALQLGLSKASGEFLTRMDADDIMPENRLQLMIDKMESLPIKSIVTGKVKYFNERGGVHFGKLNAPREVHPSISEGYRTYESWLNERADKGDYFDHIYRECVVASPNWLARTQEIQDSGIFSELNYPEDYDMTFRWMKDGFTIQGVDETTLLWREHPDRTSRNSEVYDQKSFFRLKLKWFCELHNTQTLAILGAGTKGKLTAEFLVNRTIDFNWYDLDWKKYLAPIYGKEIQNYESLNAKTANGRCEVKLLIAIYPKNKKPLLDFLTEKGFEIGRNMWFL